MKLMQLQCSINAARTKRTFIFPLNLNFLQIFFLLLSLLLTPSIIIFNFSKSFRKQNFLMSFKKDGDPDISRVFSQKIDRRFQRDFGRLINQPTNRTNEQQNEPSEQYQRRIVSNSNDHHLTVKLVEAKEEIDKLKRQLNARNEEVENVKADCNAAKDKLTELQKQLNELKMTKEKDQQTSREFTENNSNSKKVENRLLLDDYRTALTKYKTWMQYAIKQMSTMKVLLEEVGGWNEMNRYKIYFAYRAVQPEMVTDDQIPELAAGSIIDYCGAIEDVEGITSTQIRPKFHCAHTQTEESVFLNQPPSLTNQGQSPCPNSHSLMNTSFVEAGNQMSAHELRLLDLEQQIGQLEIQNAQMREQIIILSDRSKNLELLGEQKQDLQMQLEILRRQNLELIREHEQLKTAFGGSSITRNALEELIQSAEQLKMEKQELEKKLREFEGQKEGITMAESRRIGQIFKQKYGKEMADLRAKLQKYEPMHQSDTTRIYRFAQHNPLDEAHDEHLIKKAVIPAGNPLKRRKIDDDFGETSMAPSELTFLAEEEEEDTGQIRELRLQLANVKQNLEKNERAHSEFANQYRELVSQLCGYEIRLGEDGFCEAENVLSRDCIFLFRKNQQSGEEQNRIIGGEGQNQQPIAEGIDLLESESTRRWKDVVDNYLLRYHSVPAFLSAVTISLVESPETPKSTHSSISVAEETAAEKTTFANRE